MDLCAADRPQLDELLCKALYKTSKALSMGKHHATCWVGSFPPPASHPMIMDATTGSFSATQPVACGCAQKVSGIAFLNACAEHWPRRVPDNGVRSASVTDPSQRRRSGAEPFFDHYNRARAFYLSQTVGEQAHIVSALVYELSKKQHLHQQAMMLWCLRRIDEDLAERVAAGLACATRPNALVNATGLDQDSGHLGSPGA